MTLRIASLLLAAPRRPGGRVRSRWWLERRRARYAVAFTNLDLLASVVDRAAAVEALIPLAAVPARAHRRDRGDRAAAGDASARRPTARPSCCSSTCRARCARTTSSRRGSLAAAHAMSIFADRSCRRRCAVGLDLVLERPEHPRRRRPPTARSCRRGSTCSSPRAGTAIGDGLGVAVQVVKSSVGDAKKNKDGKIPGAIILLSDGAQTRGTLTPLQGADRAKQRRHPRLHRRARDESRHARPRCARRRRVRRLFGLGPRSPSAPTR